MVVFNLLFAHLLGDFVFQSNDLIQRKYKSWIGNFEHVCIIIFFTILVLFPYWGSFKMWVVAVTIFAIHFVQDWIKIKYDLKYNLKKKSTIPFFVDQTLHTSLILILAPTIQDLAPFQLSGDILNLYYSPFLIAYLMGLILVSYTYDITLFQFRRQKTKKRLIYKPNFKVMRRNITIFSLISAFSLVAYRYFM